MAPSEKQPFYDPIPPTYDEALATGSRYNAADWNAADEREAPEGESQSLLRNPNASQGGSSRRPDGYVPPTVETDDEDSLWNSDDDDDSDDEAAQVRREMQEMDIEEPSSSRGSQWRKRIGFLSLPKWKWSWRPRLPRLRIQLPSGPAAATTTTTTNDDAETANANDSEQTTEEPRRWPKWPKIDRTTAILVGIRALAMMIIVGFIYVLFASDLFGGLNSQLNNGYRFDPEQVKSYVLQHIDSRRLRASVQHFSSYAHIAGTEGDYGMALDVQSMFSRAGLDDVKLDEFVAYLNYPRKDGRAVQIMDAQDSSKAVWSAKLEEEEVGGETAGRQTYAFHGHSKSGDVKGPLIYANYGSREDFKLLQDKGINTNGAIALVRYGGTQGDRALKVKAAELAGFAGCLIYSDPAEDGFTKGKVAPEGPYMPEDGVQRGSVSLMSWVVGDVLTPGWESKEGRPRMKVEDSPGLVKIPSLPLAWRDAKVLLQNLKGHGQQVPDGWQGAVPEVEWWTGDDKSPIVRLQNEQDEETKQPIWNVYGKIFGMEQGAKSIIIGNHRDAWAFGATDPHSGTAIMIEVARIFGDLVSKGWRPLRTIEFMSWDAEEYNLIGSTEYVELNLDQLRDNAYAYINLDTVITGNEFHAAGSPVFNRALRDALGRIPDPLRNASLLQLWDQRQGELEGLGAGSDYVAFQDIAGTSSIDLTFEGSGHPYHSSYDNFKLVETVIDPEFIYHTLMTQVVSMLMLDIADRSVLPFDMKAYGQRLGGWVNDLEKWAKGVWDKGKRDGAPNNSPQAPDFGGLKDAVGVIQRKADDFEKWERDWRSIIDSSNGYESNELGTTRLAYNNKMALFETALLDTELGGGIPNRTQFKHVVFGPQLWSGYDEAFFPAIRDTIEAGEWDTAGRIISKTAAILQNAASLLEI